MRYVMLFYCSKLTAIRYMFNCSCYNKIELLNYVAYFVTLFDKE